MNSISKINLTFIPSRQSMDADSFPLHYSQTDDDDVWDAIVQNNRIHLESLLWNGTNPNLADSDGVTLLHYAVSHLQFDMIYMLVRYGANPYALDAEGETPFSILTSIMEEYDEEDYEQQNMELINIAQVKSLFLSKL